MVHWVDSLARHDQLLTTVARGGDLRALENAIDIAIMSL